MVEQSRKATSTAASVEAQEVMVGPLGLGGLLALPRQACGLVLFAHGSGSSRFSPRNRRVAAALQASGLATLLFDLLSEAEAADRAKVFDISLLAERLETATLWAERRADLSGLRIGLFGASTGAAAALVAAARLGKAVSAVVSRGGRPDLAAEALAAVRAPTLLLVGGEDREVIRLNEQAYGALSCEKVLHIVPGATHLFEEPGTLEEVMRLAAAWFLRHLAPETASRPDRDLSEPLS